MGERGKSVNPISTRVMVDYAQHITTCPLQIFRFFYGPGGEYSAALYYCKAVTPYFFSFEVSQKILSVRKCYF